MTDLLVFSGPDKAVRVCRLTGGVLSVVAAVPGATQSLELTLDEADALATALQRLVEAGRRELVR